MAKFKWILVLALGFLLTGCKRVTYIKSVPDDTLVQVTWKYATYVKEFEVYEPEKGEYYEIKVTNDVYNKVEVGSWIELRDLKEKVVLHD